MWCCEFQPIIRLQGEVGVEVCHPQDWRHPVRRVSGRGASSHQCERRQSDLHLNRTRQLSNSTCTTRWQHRASLRLFALSLIAPVVASPTTRWRQRRRRRRYQLTCRFCQFFTRSITFDLRLAAGAVPHKSRRTMAVCNETQTATRLTRLPQQHNILHNILDLIINA